MPFSTPKIAPPKINQVGLTFSLNKINADTIPIVIEIGSDKDDWPSWIMTPAINPNEATFTPSRKHPAQLDCLIFDMKGLLIAT